MLKEQSIYEYADKRERSGDRRSVFDRLTGESPNEQTSARKKLRVQVTAGAESERIQTQISDVSSSRAGAGAAATASSDESEWATLDSAWVNITHTRPNTDADAGVHASASIGAGQGALASASRPEFGNELTIRIENNGPSAASAQLPASTLVVDVAPPPQPAFKNLAISVPFADVETASSVANKDFNLYVQQLQFVYKLRAVHIFDEAGYLMCIIFVVGASHRIQSCFDNNRSLVHCVSVQSMFFFGSKYLIEFVCFRLSYSAITAGTGGSWRAASARAICAATRAIASRVCAPRLARRRRRLPSASRSCGRQAGRAAGRASASDCACRCVRRLRTRLLHAIASPETETSRLVGPASTRET